MLPWVHRIAGPAAFVIILAFWCGTASVELAGSAAAVVAVKQAIPWGLLALVPALALAGATGFAMARRSADPLVQAKRRRMPVVAGIGVIVLVPSALYLAAAAGQDDFGAAFYAVQAVELVAGAINLTLMGRNIRDGLRLTGRLRARS